jgi:hypothetical protein
VAPESGVGCLYVEMNLMSFGGHGERCVKFLKIFGALSFTQSAIPAPTWLPSIDTFFSQAKPGQVEWPWRQEQ